MSSDRISKHVLAAGEFMAFAARLRASGQSDATTVGWAVVSAAYAALHAADAYLLAKHGVAVESHAHRHTLLKQYSDTSLLRTAYVNVANAGYAVRYTFMQYKWDDFDRLARLANGLVSPWCAAASRVATS